MDLRHLKEFFEERIDAAALHALIARETQLFGARMEGGATTPLHLVKTISRADLERLVGDLINRTLEPWQEPLSSRLRRNGKYKLARLLRVV